MKSDKKVHNKALDLTELPEAILYSSSHSRSELLGEQMRGIGAKVQIVSDMNEAKKKIEEENHGFLIADVSGFDPLGVNMLNWFNHHIHKRRVKSLGILTSAATLIPKCTYHINYDNTFTVGDITFDEIATALFSLYASGSPIKWLKLCSDAYHYGKTALTTGHNESKVVLLLGDPGVGKDAFSQIAHEVSIRKDCKFVYADCRLHSGHKYTSLSNDKAKIEVEKNLQGLMAEADGGTLYFHQANLLSKEAQCILANVIRRNTCREPGTSRQRKFKGLTIVSICESSKKKLTKELLSVVSPITLRIPSLAQCKDDILILAEYFLSHFCVKESLPPMTLSERAKDELTNHNWTGNIRELFAVITRAAQISNRKVITKSDLNLIDVPDERVTKRPVNHKAFVKKALREANGKKAKAARILGTTRQTLYRWMDKYDIPDDYPNGVNDDTE